MHEMAFEFDYVGVVLVFLLIHELEKTNFDLSLLQEWTLVFDDFNGNVFLLFGIECLHHLAERTFANERIDFVAIEKLLATLDYVIKVLIVVAVIVESTLFLGRARQLSSSGSVRRLIHQILLLLLLLLLLHLKLLLLSEILRLNRCLLLNELWLLTYLLVWLDLLLHRLQVIAVLLGSTLLFGIIDLVDVLVCLDQVDT